MIIGVLSGRTKVTDRISSTDGRRGTLHHNVRQEDRIDRHTNTKPSWRYSISNGGVFFLSPAQTHSRPSFSPYVDASIHLSTHVFRPKLLPTNPVMKKRKVQPAFFSPQSRRYSSCPLVCDPPIHPVLYVCPYTPYAQTNYSRSQTQPVPASSSFLVPTNTFHDIT